MIMYIKYTYVHNNSFLFLTQNYFSLKRFFWESDVLYSTYWYWYLLVHSQYWYCKIALLLCVIGRNVRMVRTNDILSIFVCWSLASTILHTFIRSYVHTYIITSACTLYGRSFVRILENKKIQYSFTNYTYIPYIHICV